MNGIQIVLLIVLRGTSASEYEYSQDNVISVHPEPMNDEISEVNGLLYKTANKYFCEYKLVENPELLIYGTKSWSMPKQSVNLTLSYPRRSEDLSRTESNIQITDVSKYIITRFTVILLADAEDPQGFITSGGILQDSINLTFVCRNVTLLVYEFWLYGVPKHPTSYVDIGSADLKPAPNDMCSPSVHYEDLPN